MPVELAITRAGGATQCLTLSVGVWLPGGSRYVVRFASSPRIATVVIDPDDHSPEIDRANQVWPERLQ